MRVLLLLLLLSGCAELGVAEAVWGVAQADYIFTPDRPFQP